VEWRIRMDPSSKVDKDAIVWDNSDLNLLNDLIDL
jgi:hypothetical protein